MGHSHDHNHAHGANKKVLLISFFIISAYMIVELFGGIITNSLALLSDAGHMLSDAISLGVGVLAFSLGERAANYSKTYGYKRFEILAATFNGITLIVIALYIFYEAYNRFTNPPVVASNGMLIIATIGLLVNIFVAWLLMRRGDTKDNLNMRAAFLHVIGDMLGSVGAIIAALLIMFFNWGWADPLASVIVAVLVLISGWRVTKDSIHVLMEGTPRNIELKEIISKMKQIDGIINIHDLHVWSITSGHHALSCHAVVDERLTVKESQILIKRIEDELHHMGIGHVTTQIESIDQLHENSILCKTNAGIIEHYHAHSH
ncbi:cation diffusion facilitator family transporter [Pseudogracilibacillus sp. SE30717A]|uniref:cation diffusion facilitator family transporter n=1 Tax=Pseudogracilibacillus sp. SE30717A TaxID=3098293 RepID=UPI00300DD20B